jgi:hypothetical protein
MGGDVGKCLNAKERGTLNPTTFYRECRCFNPKLPSKKHISIFSNNNSLN